MHEHDWYSYWLGNGMEGCRHAGCRVQRWANIWRVEGGAWRPVEDKPIPPCEAVP